MNWSNKRVLVTGAAGFIGSTLTQKLLERGASVRTFIRYRSNRSLGWLSDLPAHLQKEIEVVAGDLTDSEAMQKATTQINIVFHLGAHIAIPYSYQHPRDVFQTNVIGTLNAATASLHQRVERFIHTSTSEVYGSARYVPIDETHPLQGQSPYSASKIGADKVVESFVDSFELPAITVRPFNSYGPRQSLRAVIPTICLQALRGQAIRLGKLDTLRDFTFVTDTAEGFIKAAECQNPTQLVYNVGSGQEWTIEQIAQKVMQITGRQLPIELDQIRLRPTRSEVTRLCSNSQLAHKELQWQPTVSIEEGLAKTLKWIEGRIQQFPDEDYVL